MFAVLLLMTTTAVSSLSERVPGRGAPPRRYCSRSGCDRRAAAKRKTARGRSDQKEEAGKATGIWGSQRPRQAVRKLRGGVGRAAQGGRATDEPVRRRAMERQGSAVGGEDLGGQASADIGYYKR